VEANELLDPDGGHTLKLDRTLPDSIELKRDAKGIYTWTIKIYGEPGQFRKTVRQIKAANRAMLKEYEGSDDTTAR
jgi:hypothetical protein